MGTITLRDYPNEILQFELPEVESDIIRIHIHMVRIYNDGTTILSVIKMTIGDKYYYYTSVSSGDALSSPAKAGSYQGYLLKKSGSGDGSELNIADSQKTKKRIENVFKNLKKYDERLPEIYGDGSQSISYGGHNGLRIYDGKIDGNISRGGKILKGGNRFFHVGNYYFHSFGCESLNTDIKYYTIEEIEDRGDAIDDEDYYGDKKGLFRGNDPFKATADFMDNIIKVYEDNVAKDIQSRIHIDIEVEDNIQKNFSKTKVYKAEETYVALYPPHEKVETVSTIKASGPILKTQKPSAPTDLK
ncbi:hypothetical protein [Olleya sp. HaHaR_3_96]|uniref:hypothetical protein n=1 Tax=Olleya sp. HaHaR_3_96 TaxID=2745560 RepID=UPI001C4EB26E|nr:hypothetical protein [Olleya sp. HaHaR_3_96]QXP58480.1 hypothetical protein H0I26_11165 [Olleya sp. HaHaR_3_96]